MAISDLVQEVLLHIERLGKTASIVICEQWKLLKKDLSREEIDQLARDGLTFRADIALHQARNRSNVPESRDSQLVSVRQSGFSNSSAEGFNSSNRVLVSVQYCVGKGEVKSLLHFTADDARFVSSQARAKAVGWFSVATFMDKITEALIVHQAKQVMDLPEHVQQELAEKWPRIQSESAE